MPAKGSSATVPGADPYAGLGGKSESAALQFGDVDAEVLKRAIEGVTRRGDAIVLSRTSDGGALSIRVLADKLVHKWYPNGMDELLHLLRGLGEPER